ncbi:MAG: hypothetical protein K8I82_14715 [Anaerolineae bacterium]|nr:hypothetical protein [Anaerolineae bacterium]
MALQTGWLKNKEGKIVHQRFYGTMTPEDIRQAALDITQKAQHTKARRLHFVVDLSEVSDVHLAAAQELQLDMRQVQAGWLVMIGENDSLLSDQQKDFTSAALNRLLSFRSRNFNTLEEGTAFLEDISELLGD